VTRPDCSVVMVSYNRSHFSRHAVDSLLRLGFDARHVLIIGRDSSIDADERVPFMTSHAPSKMEMQQIGVRSAQHDFVMLIDSDVVLGPHDAARLLEYPSALRGHPDLTGTWSCFKNQLLAVPVWSGGGWGFEDLYWQATVVESGQPIRPVVDTDSGVIVHSSSMRKREGMEPLIVTRNRNLTLFCNHATSQGWWDNQQIVEILTSVQS
jgi:hypothetical protein